MNLLRGMPAAVLLCLLFVMSVTGLQAQSSNETIAIQELSEEEAIAYLKKLQFSRDFDLGVSEGQKLLKKYSNSVELLAWHIANLARNDGEAEAVDFAEKLVEEHPDNPWSHFALARALNSYDERQEEAVAVSDKALSMNPDDHDFLWMKSAVLYVQSGKESAVSFIDSVLSTGNKSSQLLAMKGNALLSLSNDKKGDEKEEYFQRGMKAAEKARDMNPETFDAYYLPGFYLNVNGEKQKALELLEKAVTMSTAMSVHSLYWRAVRGNDNIESEEKQSKIISDLEWLRQNRPETPEMLQYISQQYGELEMDERKDELEQRVLEKYPYSLAAEWVLVGRYRNYSREHGKAIAEGADPEKRSIYRSMLWDFINRPQHSRESLLGDAYRSLFYTYREDSTVTKDTLLAVIDGMVLYEGINPHITHAGGAKELAERGIYFERAKEIAREGVDVAREKVNENREWAYETDEEYEDAMDRYTGIMYDALGWVFFYEGKLDSAEKYLSHAYSLNDENMENLYHLGKLEEKKDNLAKAEHFYKEGISVEGMGNNPNKNAVKMLYVKRNGSEEGYDSYLAGIMQKEKGNRKEEVLNGRMENPDGLSSFTMKNLEGESFSSKSLKGKVAVINIWGKWCGPCVKEMPDIQKLHEKYRDSSEVMVLTINNDPDINEVRDWMKEREFDFPVLRDNGYLNKEGMHLFPTTWFLNENSEIAFIQEGYTENLVEEFTWRIEDLSEE